MAKKKVTKSTDNSLKYWIIGIVIAVIILGLALNYSSDSSTSRQEGELGSFFGTLFGEGSGDNGEGSECASYRDCTKGNKIYCLDDTNTCVQCRNDNDCVKEFGGGDVCRGYECFVAEDDEEDEDTRGDCKNNDDCDDDQEQWPVCELDTNKCVRCVKDSDCKSNDKCTGYSCGE